MAKVVEVVERTGFVNVIQHYQPELADNEDFIEHTKRRLQMRMAEAMVARLNDGRSYVVRMWEGDRRGNKNVRWIDMYGKIHESDINSEVPWSEGEWHDYYGELWGTALIVLRDWRDAEIGEYVDHTEERDECSTILKPWPKPTDGEYSERQFNVVKFRVPDHGTMRVIQRER